MVVERKEEMVIGELKQAWGIKKESQKIYNRLQDEARCESRRYYQQWQDENKHLNDTWWRAEITENCWFYELDEYDDDTDKKCWGVDFRIPGIIQLISVHYGETLAAKLAKIIDRDLYGDNTWLGIWVAVKIRLGTMWDIDVTDFDGLASQECINDESWQNEDGCPACGHLCKIKRKDSIYWNRRQCQNPHCPTDGKWQIIYDECQDEVFQDSNGRAMKVGDKVKIVDRLSFHDGFVGYARKLCLGGERFEIGTNMPPEKCETFNIRFHFLAVIDVATDSTAADQR